LGIDELDNRKYGIWLVDISIEKRDNLLFFGNFLAIYLIKRTLRNRQRHGLEEHEMVRILE